jgi:hypothetical protein
MITLQYTLPVEKFASVTVFSFNTAPELAPFVTMLARTEVAFANAVCPVIVLTFTMLGFAILSSKYYVHCDSFAS